MDLIGALERLDPSNDEHWTNAGEPRVEAVSALLGEDVTRAAIQNAAPGFVRPDSGETGEGSEESGTSDDPRTDEEAPPADPREAASDRPDPYKFDGGPSDPAERKAWLEASMHALAEDLRKGAQVLDALNREYQTIAKEAPDPTPEERFKADKAHYNLTQEALRADRSERLQMLRDSKVDINQIAAIVHPSRLDAAMARRNTRGARRPQFHPDGSPKKDTGAA